MGENITATDHRFDPFGEVYFDEMCNLVSRVEERSKENSEILVHLFGLVEAALESLHQLEQSERVPKELSRELIQNFIIFSQEITRDLAKPLRDPRVAIFTNFSNVKQSSVAGPGRPKFKIPEEQLVYFRNLGYTWTDISSMLLISRWTVARRVKEYGIEHVTGFSNITDDELDNKIRQLQVLHGKVMGRSLILGHLSAQGLRVQVSRVRKALVRLDPGTSRIRWACLVKRRKYSVPAPNSLWHADGHHSLVSWGFVIHGAIDGYSRLIVYLQCATNNCKETVQELFQKSIVNFGIPSRLRTDKGGENALLWSSMEELRGRNRRSFITGSSTHNQRIERLWRDVWIHVCHLFYYTFQAMEAEGILDVTNEKHMFILHFVFKPRINKAIESFQNGWNRHPLRTEKNWSPLKLWTNGMVDIRNRGNAHIGEIRNDDLNFFGLDPQAPMPFDTGFEQVEVHDVPCTFTDLECDTLNNLNVIQESQNFGIDIFLEALSVVDV